MSGSILGLTGFVLVAGPGLGAPWRTADAPTPAAACQVTLTGSGTYRLTVATGGPVPVVNFQKAVGPRFEPIRTLNGRPADCDVPMGPLTISRSPNASPLLFHVANELYALARVEWQSSRRTQLEYAYRDYGNMIAGVRTEMLLAGFRQILASVAADLISRYANPTGALTDKGAKWVAETAVKLMMEAYVEGRDPGLIIDGLLTRMVDHLRGHADNLAQSVGGPALKEALKPHLTAIANDVKAALVEAQPDGQTVTVDASTADGDCSHFLYLAWNFKGGSYNGRLVIRCGPQRSDWISRVDVTTVALEPGEAGAINAQAFSQLGVPMPLGAATITGVSPVPPVGSGEPNAVLAGAVATFNFAAANPRRDADFDNMVRLTTTAVVGTLMDVGHGKVTVLNVAPTIEGIAPGGASARPGERLELDGAIVTVLDANADAMNPGEVGLASLRLAHPDGLKSTPRFDRADDPRQLSHDGTSGRYQFRFSRGGLVEKPHPHGTWPAIVTVADDNGQVATGSVALTVDDVAPAVVAVTVSPAFVHREPGAQVSVTVRVEDSNGAEDITAVRVDATQAGGAVYAHDNGLVETGRGPDWIEYRTASTFGSTKVVGEHPLPVVVTDETNRGTDQGILHVGNVAPTIGGYGYLVGGPFTPVRGEQGDLDLTRMKDLCPGDPFRAGVIAHDPENDALVVVGLIVETGGSITFQETSPAIFIGDMTAPGEPGTYTLRFTVSERPPDKQTVTEVPLIVHPCEEGETRVAIGDPVTPADVAVAPRDETSQAFLGSFGGTQVAAADPAAPGNGSGPSVRALADSLTELLATLGGRPTAGALEVETYLVATGGSTGPVVQFFGINRTGVPVTMPTGPLVFEPVRIDASAQQRIGALLQRLVAAGGRPQLLNAYCLELLRKPPSAGTVMRVASASVQQPFTSLSRLFEASDRLNALGRLHPDSDAEGYFHAIRQWSIWTHQERLNLGGFEREFLRVTRENFEQAGDPWTAQVEAAVRGLVPNRWNDIQQVLQEMTRGDLPPDNR
jgi:hypothetical protein